MSRYVTAPAAIDPKTPTVEYHWDGPHLPTCNVDGPKTVDTGLVDLSGNAIMRVQPPIGFGRDAEW